MLSAVSIEFCTYVCTEQSVDDAVAAAATIEQDMTSSQSLAQLDTAINSDLSNSLPPAQVILLSTCINIGGLCKPQVVLIQEGSIPVW